MQNNNALVIGAGVTGLTTALKLIERGFHVTIWSREAAGVSPHTSASAYAMWVPVKIDTDPRIERWANTTLTELQKLAADPRSGVALRPIFVLKPEKSEPWYADSVAGFRHGRPDEFSGEYADAHVLDAAPVIDPVSYLPWLRSKVFAAGARFQQRAVNTLEECPGKYGVIVNCAGLGARELAGDPGVVPERVQVVTIKHNGFDRVVIDDEGPNKRACIVPHRNYIKLGAVFDGARESLEVDEEATLDILSRCRAMVPRFQADRADVLSVVRAIRPERSLPRVEEELLPDGRIVVHNYGHDGMGYILSIGIAGHIAESLSSK